MKKGNDEEEEEAKELQPKRALSAYIYFASEYREELVKKNPDMPQKEIMTECGKRWNEMSDGQKKKFNDLNAQDKLRQEKQLADLKTKGFFVLDDGSKSTDEKNVPKPTRKIKKASDSLSESADEAKPAVRKPLKKAD